ncbi:MAG: formyltransferase family protein [Planctomycetota bacterium]
MGPETRADEGSDKAAVPRRLAVLVSGSGRTLINLIERTRGDEPKPRAEVALVIADRACRGFDLAREADIEGVLIEGGPDAKTLAALADRHEIGLVVLAGYLRLVRLPEELRGRVVNIHPALLPSFGGKGMHGMRVHEAVIDAAKRGEVRESGCTVHLCDDRYDTGAIVLQRTCEVSAGDTPEQLAARVFALELEAYPEAIELLLERANA